MLYKSYKDNKKDNKKDIMWFFTKQELYNSLNKHKHIIIAADKDINIGTKIFAAFEAIQTFILYQQSIIEPHFYEIVLNKYTSNTYIYIDIDRSFDHFIITDAYYDELISKFKYIFEKFIKDIYNQEIHLELGQNYQIAYTPSPNKLSCHIKINIKSTPIIIQNIIHNFDKYMCSNTYITQEDRDLFYYINNKKKYVPIIDKSVYSNFRSFRTLYSSKFKTDLKVKIPYPNSSIDIEDHLVCVYKDIPQQLINIDLQIKDIIIPADYSLITEKHITKYANNYNSDTVKIIPAIPIENINIIETLISNKLSSLFDKKEILFQYNKFITPTIYIYGIDKSSNTKCLYADHIHKSNRSFFEYNYNKKIIKFCCFNEKCKLKTPISFAITSEFDNLSLLDFFDFLCFTKYKKLFLIWL